jgi:TonB family protein
MDMSKCFFRSLLSYFCFVLASFAVWPMSTRYQEVTLDGTSVPIVLPADWEVGQAKLGASLRPQVVRYKGDPPFEISVTQNTKSPQTNVIGLPFECDFAFDILASVNQGKTGYLEQRPDYFPQDFYARVLLSRGPAEGQSLFACLYLGNSSLAISLRPVPSPSQGKKVTGMLQAIARAGRTQSTLLYSPGTIHLPVTTISAAFSSGIWGVGEMTSPGRGVLDLLVRTGGSAEVKIMPYVANGNCSVEMNFLSQKKTSAIASAPTTVKTQTNPDYISSNWDSTAVEVRIERATLGGQLWITTCRQLTPKVLLLANVFYGSPEIAPADTPLIAKYLDEIVEGVLRGPKDDGALYIPKALTPEAESTISMTTLPADLNQLLGDISAVAKAGDKEKLASVLKGMEISNYKEWFVRTFGEEKGAKLADAYEKSRGSGYKLFIDSFVSGGDRGGTTVAVRIPSQHVEGEPSVVYDLRAALKEPTVFYAAGYFWKEPGLTHNSSLGFLTKIDGSYRSLPGNILWDLKTSDATPGAGISIDPQALQLLKLVASNPQIPPMPSPAPAVPGAVAGEVPSGVPGGSMGGVIGGVIGGMGSAPPRSDATRIKQGGNITAAMLLKRVDPVYPPLARQTRISGTVRLHAIIDTDGSVLEVEVVSGHPLLVQSALNAVRQWQYQPTLFNGRPVQIDTTVDVIFVLNP